MYATSGTGTRASITTHRERRFARPRTLLRRAVLAVSAAAVAATTLSSAPASAADQDAAGRGASAAVLDVDPYWGDINPSGYSRTVPSESSADPYWRDPRKRYTVHGYLHLADADYWASDISNDFDNEWNGRREGFLHWAEEPEFATANGNWAAQYRHRQENAYETTPLRSMQWRRVNYGAWCRTSDDVAGWNQYLGEWACLPNRAHLEATYPGYSAAKDACVAYAKTARPSGSTWTGSPNVYEPTRDGSTWLSGGDFCHDAYVTDPSVWSTLSQDSLSGISVGMQETCAPWEDQRVSPTTWAAYCQYTFYDWANDPIRPAGGFHPPAGEPKGDIDGPGENTDGYTRSATHTAKANLLVDETVQVTRTVRVKRDRVTVSVTKQFGRKKVTAKASAPVRVPGSGTASLDVDETVTASATETASCRRDTAAQASECAEEKARQAAEKKALAAATTARSRLLADARRQLGPVANDLARTRAQAGAIPRSAISKAKKVARLRALRKLEAERP